MTTPVPTAAVDEQKLYPVHEEDSVPETSPHEFAVRYVRDALAVLLRDCLVTGDICIYWERGNMQRYAAPDVLVARGRPRLPLPRTYLLWREPPVSFVAEIGSDRSRQIDLEEKPGTYSEHVKAQEYLYADPPDPESPLRELRLWRLGAEGYLPVERQENGRLWSEVLGVEFGWDATDMLRIYVDGVPQPTHEESEQRAAEERQRRQEAEAARAEEARHRQEAEAARAEEARRRQEAEAGAQAAAEQRQAAEARAADEANRRREAETRAADEAALRQELERQLAELRARLGE
jgi:Uma2 family endonuclease